MTTDSQNRQIWKHGRIILASLALLILVGGLLLYMNFNGLLSDALLRTFNSHIISDVYELKFEHLRVNVVNGSVSVKKVSIHPRDKPLKEYPYINSSFHLATDELNLENVGFVDLLRSGTLKLERIAIVRPQITLKLDGGRAIFFPFSDSIRVTNQPAGDAKKTISNFLLRSFEVIDANFLSKNLEKNREFRIDGLSLMMDSLLINQHYGQDVLELRRGELRIKTFDGRMKLGLIRHVVFGDFRFELDSLGLRNSVDTMIYKARDTRMEVGQLDLQTKDSLFHVVSKSFELSSKERMLRIRGLQFKPNRSFEYMQKKYEFAHTDAAFSVGMLEVRQLDFFLFVHLRRLFIEEIHLDSVKATLFADLTKPRDPKVKPPYLGQSVTGLGIPVLIKKVRAEHIHLINRERKPDSTLAEVHLTQATVEVNNITNLSSTRPLVMNTEALLAGKTHFKATLTFEYSKPQFKFEGVLDKFNLPDLNPIIEAYTPAKITKGVADEISFSGIAEATTATGTMKFIYHDLQVDVHLKKKARWMSSVLTFTANTALHNSNPASEKLPPRVVRFSVDRDPRKGFINLLVKSLLSGLKETMFMSRENRKAYKEAKKKVKE